MDTRKPDPFDPGWLERRKIPKGSYLSPGILDLEARRLWLNVWQMACRVEEIPNHGDFVVYDIMDESVIVLKSGDAIRAYHNVCPHRGRRIAGGSGKVMGRKYPGAGASIAASFVFGMLAAQHALKD
jgi:hypothetical protein